METHTPNMLAPPQPKKSRPSGPTVNEVSYVSNPASVEEQQGGAQQEASPSSASAGSDEGFTPQGTQQQLFVQPEGPPLGIDGEMTMPTIMQGNGGIPPRAGIDDWLPPSLFSNPSAPGGSSSTTPDQEKTKLIQQQLMLLLHAHKCQQRERESKNYRCSLPYCQVMKEVVRHIMQCTKTRDCSYPHCASSRQIIQHWKSCGKQDCSICMPVKGVIKPTTFAQGVGGAGMDGVSGPVTGSFTGPTPSTSMMQDHPTMVGQPPAPGEQWQNSVRQDVRDHLIKKIVNGIYPVTDYNSAMTNPQYSRLVQFIRRIEDNFFKTCASKDEYFAKLGDKYQHIVKELQRTSPQRPAMPMPVSSSTGSVPPIKSLDSGLGQSPSASRSSLDTMGPLPSVPTPTAVDSIPSLSVGPADLVFPASQQQADVAMKQKTDGTLTESKLSVEMQRRPSITSPTAGNDVTTPSQPVVSGGVGEGPAPLTLPSPTTQLPPQPTVKTPTSATPSIKVVPNPNLKKVFTKEELENALRPVFNYIWNHPDAWPFQEPVIPERLNIPDYFTIVKEPMDLATIDRKLSNGMYSNPWEFCKDIWLMIDNAWLYNRKTSKVYRMCSTLFEVFNEVIDGAMRSLGYCCGMRYSYSPQVLYCYSKNLCPIPRDAPYYACDGRYLFCSKCFLEMPGETVSIGEDGYTPTVIEKCKFQELKNDHVEQEPMIDCIHCCRTLHKVCALWHESIWPEGYQCDSCLTALGTLRKDNKFAAKKLPTTQLGMHLEKRVNTFLQTSGSGAGEITVRVVSSSRKTIETKPGMREKYAGEFPVEMPYCTKAMFVFEEVDGVDVCFFGMYVQEYSSDCPTPNTRRVYISYLDSVHFFQPREYRTPVYHEIIIGYMEFVKKQGFSTAHIWVCPPSEGEDYIFHCHPSEQKMPKSKRLVRWCCNMLERGKDQGVVHSYMDFYDYCQKENLTSPEQLPYFEGDFWPNVIEEQIKELDHELKEERKAKAEEYVRGKGEVHNSKGASKLSSNKKPNNKKAGKSKQMKKVGDLSQRIFSIMEKHREVFFVVQLHDPNLPSTKVMGDPDPLLTSDLMEGRDAFLTLAREKHWEFSSLRRAKFSTLAMLVTLHIQGGDWFLYTCNMCQQPVETRYHCSECEDFDLCVCCYEENGHEHMMTCLGMDLDISDEGTGPKDPKEAQNRAIQHFIQVLVHAAQCRDRNCKSPACTKMKRIMSHVKGCKQCGVCKQFLSHCLQHAKACKSSNCPVPLCANLKKHILEKQRQTSIQENRFAARRMLAMRSAMSTTSSSLGSSSNGGDTVQSPAPSVSHRQQPSTATQKDDCHDASQSGEAEIATLAEEVKDLKQQRLLLQQDLTEAKEKCSGLKKEVSRLLEEKGNLEAKLKETEFITRTGSVQPTLEVKDLKQQQLLLQQDLTEAKDECSVLKKEVSRLLEEKGNLEAKLKETELIRRTGSVQPTLTNSRDIVTKFETKFQPGTEACSMSHCESTKFFPCEFDIDLKDSLDSFWGKFETQSDLFQGRASLGSKRCGEGISPLPTPAKQGKWLKAEGPSLLQTLVPLPDFTEYELTLRRLCWMPNDMQEKFIGPEGGTVDFGNQDAHLEFPPGALEQETRLRFAILLCGPFQLPNGYLSGSVTVYINLGKVTLRKAFKLHLSSWFGGRQEDAQQTLRFARAYHKLPEEDSVKKYQFALLEGGDFTSSSKAGILEIGQPKCLYQVVAPVGEQFLHTALAFCKEDREEVRLRIIFCLSSPTWSDEITALYEKNEWMKHNKEPILFKFLDNKQPITAKLNADKGRGWEAQLEGGDMVNEGDITVDMSSGDLLDLVEKKQYPPSVDCLVLYTSPINEWRGVEATLLRVNLTGTNKGNICFTCKVKQQAGAEVKQELPMTLATTVTAERRPLDFSATKNAKHVQVIQEHAAKFLNEMNSEEIASQLKVLNLIPESVEHCIQHSTCREDANGHLLTYLKKDATEEQVRGVFTIASQNYGRMSEFAANLLQKLLKVDPVRDGLLN